ncbi:MAG TPA: GreA/GreB family elongation factor [Pseudonocardiaceae bacterium]|nr:GreA/GreB family elongation factor [Pseudonocardiaceae bacterium]
MSTTSDLSPEARKRLEQELARLRERRRTLAAELEQRDMVGDRADNAEALELGDDLVWVEEHIAELVARLAGVQPADGADRLPGGTEVTLRFADGTEATLRVVTFPEEIPEGAEDTALTVHSPLGRALVGHHPGDTIRYPTPDGLAHAELLDLRLPGA